MSYCTCGSRIFLPRSPWKGRRIDGAVMGWRVTGAIYRIGGGLGWGSGSEVSIWSRISQPQRRDV